ncbi:MAG: hypothetical protein QXX78_05825, partial [Nitrososphaerota archaeon]
ALTTLLIISFIIKFIFFLFGIEGIRINFPLSIFEVWRDYIYAYVPTVQTFKKWIFTSYLLLLLFLLLLNFQSNNLNLKRIDKNEI